MKTLHYSIIIVTAVSITFALVIYDYESHLFISKQQAIDMAVQDFHCNKPDQYVLDNPRIVGKLLHIKHNLGFFVDERNMQDMSVEGDYFFDDKQSGEYVWEIVLPCFDPHDTFYNESENSIRFVDAKSGTMLK